VDGGSSGTDGGQTGDGNAACDDRGGLCMSDRDDPSLPAFCEEFELVEIAGACADLDRACCAPSPANQCEAIGGACHSAPGTSAPFDCADLGLVSLGGTCSGLDQTCCG
jgi:hypothetical protein